MKRILTCIGILIVTMAILAACSSQSLEKNLTSKSWIMTNSLEEIGDMDFYDDGTAICDWGLLKSSYQWTVENKQLTLIWDEDVFIYDVAQDQKDGYVMNLIDGDHDSYVSYDVLKLMPSK